MRPAHLRAALYIILASVCIYIYMSRRRRLQEAAELLSRQSALESGILATRQRRKNRLSIKPIRAAPASSSLFSLPLSYSRRRKRVAHISV